MDIQALNDVLSQLRWEYHGTPTEQTVQLNDFIRVRFPAASDDHTDGGAQKWIERKHRAGGMHEPAVFAALVALADSGVVDGDVLDVGALYGYFTLLAASILPRGNLHAFEPNPASFRGLQRNVAANPGILTRVRTNNAVVSEASNAFASVSLRGFSVFEDDPDGAAIEVASIDDYCERHQVKPSVIKIDVEGYQLKVLHGAMAAVRTYRPAILLEFDAPNKMARLGASNRDVVMPLAELGYRCFYCPDHRSVKDFREVAINAIGPDEDTNSLGVFVAT